MKALVRQESPKRPPSHEKIETPAEKQEKPTNGPSPEKRISPKNRYSANSSRKKTLSGVASIQ